MQARAPSAPPIPEPPATDAEVVRRLLARDEATFAALVASYHPAMARVAGDILRDRAQVHDVIQEAWVAVLDSLPRFEGRSSLKTWVFHILGHRALSAARKRAQAVAWLEPALPEEPGEDEARFGPWGSWQQPPATWAPSPEGQLLDKEVRLAIAQELEGLPPGQRAVVTLRDVEGLSGPEVCEALGLSEANARVLLHRGRTRLRARLEERFGRRSP